MKTKLLFIASFLFCYSVSFVAGQERSDYSTEFIDGPGWNFTCATSTYWMGNTYIFGDLGSYGLIRYSRYSINSNGDLNRITMSDVTSVNTSFNLTSCVYKKNMYIFYWESEGDHLLKYFYRTPDDNGWFSEIKDIPVNSGTENNMSAVAYNGNLYLFYVDKDDRLVKYYEFELNGDGPDLSLVSTEPTVFNGETSYGNVAAITYINSNMKEKLMVAYPQEFLSKANNEISIHTGEPGNFSLLSKLHCKQDYSCYNIAMAQGSVKGASEGSYNIQFGYTHQHSDSGLERCELNIDNNDFSDWEGLSYDGYHMGKAVWFSEFYSKSSQVRKKFLLQGYNCGDGARGCLWESDILQYKDQISEIPPFDRRNDFFDVILVAEGAPPYALNGYQLGDYIFNGNPISEFSFTTETENSLTTSTTYSKSVEANMGIGPVSAGFKASFQEGSGTTNTETLVVTQKILPPTSQQDSSGVMWYYYVAPTITRSRWQMQDFNGNDISPERNLFFFNFDSPQLKTMALPLTNYNEMSPRSYDLHTYEARNVEGIDGIERILRNETDINIKQGGTGSLELTFSEVNTDFSSKNFEVSLGIDASVGIFSASANASAGFEYSRERTTSCSESFYINWNLFAPLAPENPDNVRKYTAISYLMKTTNSSAYFLLDGMEGYYPYFLTYEVKDIEHGDFINSIGEQSVLIEKYKFMNYPNPSANTTRFHYVLSDNTNVSLEVFNLFGVKTGISVSESQYPGQQKIDINTSQLPSGVYYYNLKIGSDLISGKYIKL